MKFYYKLLYINFYTIFNLLENRYNYNIFSFYIIYLLIKIYNSPYIISIYRFYYKFYFLIISNYNTYYISIFLYIVKLSKIL